MGRNGKAVACEQHQVLSSSHPMSRTASDNQEVGVLEKTAFEIMNVWSRACTEFRERERREIIETEPSPERLASHLKELKAMIKLTGSLLAQVSDPDFPARQFASEVRGRLLQLEHTWELLNDPMPAEEADGILARCFPDEPGT